MSDVSSPASFALSWLGDPANSQAVLSAFVLGLTMSSHYQQHRKEQQRMLWSRLRS